ncbi:MAG: response regulator [Verrucomicrobia bacterium]|nr:response regulator [Verrucomicrobiota bacterium]
MAKLADGLGVSLAALFTLANGLPAASESQVPIASPPEPAEILLLEDDPNDAELTRRAFQRADIVNPVRVVHDGEEALDFVFGTGVYARRKGARLPQVILLDLKLPGMNGLEVLRRLKADERTKHIPVAVLTGSTRDRDVVESVRLGAGAYILKPVDFSRFTKIVPQMSFAWALLKSPTPMSG